MHGETVRTGGGTPMARPNPLTVGSVPLRELHERAHHWILPDHVTTNVPRHGGLGIHQVARGLLCELAAYTGARPLALTYTEREHQCWDRRCCRAPLSTSDIRADLTRPPRADRALTVALLITHDHSRAGRHEHWAVVLNDRPLADSSRTGTRRVPSACDIARAVYQHLRGW